MKRELPGGNLAEESAVDVAAFVPDSLQERNFRPLSGLAQPTIKENTDTRGRVGQLNSNPAPKFRPFQWLKKKR